MWDDTGQRYCKLILQQVCRNKRTWCLTSTETARLIRDGEKGGWDGVGVGAGVGCVGR